MATYPTVPTPSSISTPEIVDPVLRFAADSGYEYRRSLASRPRRRYQHEYLGLTADQLRVLREFVISVRNGALPFDWIHATVADVVQVANTTPVILTFQHTLLTGQWVHLTNLGGGTTIVSGAYQVTRLNATQVSLDGIAAAGVGTIYARMYFPVATLVLAEDTLGSATKLIGPEQLASRGRFSAVLTVQEVF